MAIDNSFALFDVPTRLDLSFEVIQKKYRLLQRQFHPDNFATASALERQQALLKSAAINEAFVILKNPLKRAQHWCALHGVESAPIAPEVLMQQMEWRERLEAVAGDSTQLVELQQELEHYSTELAAKVVAASVDEAALECFQLVQEWQFIEKIKADIAAVEL